MSCTTFPWVEPLPVVAPIQPSLIGASVTVGSDRGTVIERSHDMVLVEWSVGVRSWVCVTQVQPFDCRPFAAERPGCEREASLIASMRRALSGVWA